MDTGSCLGTPSVRLGLAVDDPRQAEERVNRDDDSCFVVSDATSDLR